MVVGVVMCSPFLVPYEIWFLETDISLERWLIQIDSTGRICMEGVLTNTHAACHQSFFCQIFQGIDVPITSRTRLGLLGTTDGLALLESGQFIAHRRLLPARFRAVDLRRGVVENRANHLRSAFKL